MDEEGKEISRHLQQSATELDDIVRSITKAIESSEKAMPGSEKKTKIK
jgi:hypothetical protein